MKIRVLRPCSVIVQAGSEILVDDLTGEPLIRAKLAEKVEDLPPVETPKRRYRNPAAETADETAEIAERADEE